MLSILKFLCILLSHWIVATYTLKLNIPNTYSEIENFKDYDSPLNFVLSLINDMNVLEKIEILNKLGLLSPRKENYPSSETEHQKIFLFRASPSVDQLSMPKRYLNHPPEIPKSQNQNGKENRRVGSKDKYKFVMPW
ncbi:unnamed protein product [Gordionus sp. m RMFG-2023]